MQCYALFISLWHGPIIGVLTPKHSQCMDYYSICTATN